MMDYYGYYNGMNFFGPFFMILVWGLIIWAIVVMIRMFTNPHKPSEQGDRALAILRERYAKGEMSKEEFEERLKGLSN